MIELLNTTDRQLIPRWNTSGKMQLSGQIRVDVDVGSMLVDDEWTAEKRLNWIQFPSRNSAIDLFLALEDQQRISDSVYPIVRDFLLREIHSVGPGLKALLLKENIAYSSQIDTSNNVQLHKVIHQLRNRTKEFPEVALNWNDLAFYYTILDEKEKAKKCMSIAVNLHPKHSWLNRSFARLLFHQGEPDRALHSLAKTGLVKSNPWLLSADIAIRMASKIERPDVASARRLLGSYVNKPGQISELAASIGTLEIKNGSTKKGKIQLIQASKVPTENTIAQLRWIAQQHKVHVPLNDHLARSQEAKAISYYSEKNYRECRDTLIKYFESQPFISEPLLDAGYLSLTILNEPCFVEQISKRFESVLKNSFTATNNLIVARLELGKFDGITEQLEKLEVMGQSPDDLAVATATRGMYAYYSGEIEFAKLCYKNSLFHFKERRQPINYAIALLYQGITEKKCELESAKATLEKAKSASKKLITYPELLEKVNQELAELMQIPLIDDDNGDSA